MIDQHSENQRGGSVDLDDGVDSEDEVSGEEFRIIGYPMSLKRQRRDFLSSSSFSSLSPSKIVTVKPDLETLRATVQSWANNPFPVADPALRKIMERQRQRQIKGIGMITLENYICQAVLDALESYLTNKYSKGTLGARYYGRNQYIDKIGRLCCEQALAAFILDPECWGGNVLQYLCTSANFAVYMGLLRLKYRIMGLTSLSGGHVSHGYFTPIREDDIRSVLVL